MKFLIDQNVSPKITQFLKYEGYDAKDVRELKLEGASDSKILLEAQSQANHHNI